MPRVLLNKIWNSTPQNRTFKERWTAEMNGKKESKNSVIYTYIYIYIYVYIYIYHHHHIVLAARISLTLSRHSSLSFIALGRSSGQQPVSSHSC